MDCSPPGSSVHEILQARILEWVAFPSLGDFPDPGIEPTLPMSPALQVGLYLLSHQAFSVKCQEMSLSSQTLPSSEMH